MDQTSNYLTPNSEKYICIYIYINVGCIIPVLPGKREKTIKQEHLILSSYCSQSIALRFNEQ